MHEDYVKDSVDTDLQLEQLQLHVLSPVDLAVSKIARLADVDRADIQQLVAAGLVTPQEIEDRATQAMVGYIGGMEMLKLNLRDALACAREGFARRQGSLHPGEGGGGDGDGGPSAALRLARGRRETQ